MEEDDYLTQLKACDTADDWNQTCDRIKHDHGGDYPSWWFESVIMSGLMRRITAKF